MDDNQRIFAFLFGCIGSRSLLTYIAYISNKYYLRYLSYITFIISISFIYLYISNSRQIAFEAGGKVWWTNLRLVHGINYLIFSILAFNGNKYSYIFLLIDVIIAIIAYILHKRYKISF